MADVKGWQLLHSKLPGAALKPLPKAAYGIEGLTDVNEAYLIQRLFASDLSWQWKITGQSYLGYEDRKGRDSDYTIRWYLASVSGELVIDGRSFAGSGAHDNKKLDAAYKGAATVAFKNACKLAGLTIELFKDGKAMDFIYESHPDDQGARTTPVTPSPAASDASLAPDPLIDGQGAGEPVAGARTGSPPTRTPQEILDGARKHAKEFSYAREDAVCRGCGRKEFIRPYQGSFFCSKRDGGCGFPAKGSKWVVMTYGEWLEKQDK